MGDEMDAAEIDENGNGILFSGKSIVEKCERVEGQPNVYLLQTTVKLERTTQIAPKAGQFFMIKGQKSDVVYNRPISVYHSEEKINVTTGKKSTWFSS